MLGVNKRNNSWIHRLYINSREGPGKTGDTLKSAEAVERLFPEDQWALGTAYGHRALILKDWGKLEEAPKNCPCFAVNS